jgi:hypothetical protein
MNKTLIGLLGVAILIVGFLYFSGMSVTPFGAAPSGLATTIATSGPIAVDTTQITVIATSTNCTTRQLSTNNSAIKLTIGDADGDVPTGTNGIWQAASSTVVYDSGQWGCGALKVYSYVAQTINATETR